MAIAVLTTVKNLSLIDWWMSNCADTHLRASCKQSMDTIGNRLSVRRIASVRVSFKKVMTCSKSWTLSTQTSTWISLLSARSLSSFVRPATWYLDGGSRCTELGKLGVHLSGKTVVDQCGNWPRKLWHRMLKCLNPHMTKMFLGGIVREHCPKSD